MDGLYIYVFIIEDTDIFSLILNGNGTASIVDIWLNHLSSWTFHGFNSYLPIFQVSVSPASIVETFYIGQDW